MTTEVGYRKVYAIRRPLSNRKSLEVTFPYEYAEREARKLGINVEQFLQRYSVVCEFNSSATLTYTIIEK